MADNTQLAFNVNIKVEEIDEEINAQLNNEINKKDISLDNVHTGTTNKQTLYTQVINIDDSEDDNVASENSNSSKATEVARCNREDNSHDIAASSCEIDYEASNSSDSGNEKKFYILNKNMLYKLSRRSIHEGIEEQTKKLSVKSDFILNQVIRHYHPESNNSTRTIHDTLLDNAIELWKNNYESKSKKNTLVLYKCYVCNKGWRRLDPFRQHIVIHKHPHLLITIEQVANETSLVASIGFPKKTKLVTVHLNCWKCNKPLKNLVVTKLSPDNYTCETCQVQLYTNVGLQNDNACKIGNYNVSCTVCSVYCPNEDMLYKHMILDHTPKSDEPAVTNPKICNSCEEKYFILAYHDCPKRSKLYKCYFCWNKYISKSFLQLHMAMNKNFSTCPDCSKKFKQCYLIEHLLHHSKNYEMVQYCLKCNNNVLYTNNDQFLKHMINHGNSTQRRKYSVKMMLPVKCIEGLIVDSRIHIDVPDDLLYEYLADIYYMNNTPLEIINIIKEKNNKPLIASEPNDNDNQSKKSKQKSTANQENTENNVIENTVANTENEASDYESDNYAFQIQLDAEIQRDIEIEEEICKVFKASRCYKKFLDKEANEPIDDAFDDVCVIERDDEVLVISDTDDETRDTNKEDKNKEDINKEVFIDVKKENDSDDTDNGKYNSVDIEIEETVVNDVTVKIESCDISELCNDEHTDSEIKNKFEPTNNLNDSVIKEENNIVKHENESVIDFFNFNTDIKAEAIEGLVLNNIQCEIEVSDWNINEIAGSSKKRKIQRKNNKNIKYYKSYTCTHCSYTGLYKEFIQHITSCQKKEIICTYCKKYFDDFDTYLIHFTEHKFKYLSCPQCLKNFTVLRLLNNHVLNHISELYANIQNDSEENISKNYLCELCHNFVDIEDFFIHWESHLDLNDGIMDTMEDSEAVMKSMMTPEMVEQALEILLEDKRGNKHRVCIVCNKKFSRRIDSKRHLIEHLLHEAKVNMAVTGAKLRCPMCDLDILELSTWRRHMRDHAQLRVYRCKLCPKTFCDSSNYSKHRKVHNQHKYICDLCGGKFCAKASIVRHLVDHEPMNPMSCTKCHKTFASEHRLKRHMRVRHVPSQFACAICKRKFSTCKQRWDHMWNNHKIRKYPADCPICNKQYRRLIDVKTHLKLEHGIKRTDDFYRKPQNKAQQEDTKTEPLVSRRK